MSDESLLSLKDLKVHFHTMLGVVRAVDGVSIEIPRKRIVGIVGESGCGKSVMARSILGIVPPPGRVVGGEIVYRGSHDLGAIDLATLDPRGKPIRRFRGQEIAMIFQEPMSSLSPVHTVGNQLMEAISLYSPGISATDARARTIDLLREVGIPSPATQIDAHVFELSGGMRQRVLIALSIAGDPKVLIADEPTTAIDVTIQAKVLKLLRSIQEETDMSIVFITHNLGVIAQVAHEVYVMYLGRIVESGPVDQIFEDPQHPYTQKLIKSIPSVETEPKSVLDTIEGTLPDPYEQHAGCRFASRCPAFMPDVCDRAEPELYAVGANRSVRCFLHDAQAATQARES